MNIYEIKMQRDLIRKKEGKYRALVEDINDWVFEINENFENSLKVQYISISHFSRPSEILLTRAEKFFFSCVSCDTIFSKTSFKIRVSLLSRTVKRDFPIKSSGDFSIISNDPLLEYV